MVEGSVQAPVCLGGGGKANRTGTIVTIGKTSTATLVPARAPCCLDQARGGLGGGGQAVGVDMAVRQADR